jgi:hypothetical protein
MSRCWVEDQNPLRPSHIKEILGSELLEIEGPLREGLHFIKFISAVCLTQFNNAPLLTLVGLSLRSAPIYTWKCDIDIQTLIYRVVWTRNVFSSSHRDDLVILHASALLRPKKRFFSGQLKLFQISTFKTSSRRRNPERIVSDGRNLYSSGTRMDIVICWCAIAMYVSDHAVRLVPDVVSRRLLTHR